MTDNEVALKLAREIIELSSHDPPIEGMTRIERVTLAAILEVTERAAALAEEGQHNRVYLATPLSITNALRRMEHLT